MYRRVKIFFGNNRSNSIYFLKDITEYGGVRLGDFLKNVPYNPQKLF